MHKNPVIIILFFCFLEECFAQIPVNGTVSLYNSNAKYGYTIWVKGVSISKESGESVESDNKGYFSIQFSGEWDNRQKNIFAIPPKNGEYRDYIVVEKSPIEITVGRKELVRISICSNNEFNSIIQQLAKPLIDKANSQFSAKIKDLEEKLKRKELTDIAYNDSINFLINEINIWKKNYQELAESVARNNPDFADARRMKVRKLMEQGKLDSIKYYLPPIEITTKQIKNNKQDLEFWTHYYKAIRDVENTLKVYKERLENTGVHKDQFQLLMECAEYSLQNRLFDTALAYVNNADELTKILSVDCKIKSQNLKGKIEQKKGYDNFYQNYKQAIKLYQGIKKKHNNDMIFIAEKEAAISYHLLGDYYNDKKGKKEAAKTNYHKAMDIYTELNRNGEIEAEEQAIVLLKLAAQYDKEKKESMVKKCVDKIDELIKADSLLEVNPNYKLWTAIYWMLSGKSSEVENDFDSILKIYERKASTNPMYMKNLLETYFFAGLNQFYNKHYTDALEYFSQGAILLSKMDITSQEYYRKIKCYLYAAMGIASNLKTKKGQDLYQEALTLAENNKELQKNIKYIKEYNTYDIRGLLTDIVVSGVVFGGYFVLPNIF